MQDSLKDADHSEIMKRVIAGGDLLSVLRSMGYMGKEKVINSGFNENLLNWLERKPELKKQLKLRPVILLSTYWQSFMSFAGGGFELDGRIVLFDIISHCDLPQYIYCYSGETDNTSSNEGKEWSVRFPPHLELPQGLVDCYGKVIISPSLGYDHVMVSHDIPRRWEKRKTDDEGYIWVSKRSSTKNPEVKGIRVAGMDIHALLTPTGEVAIPEGLYDSFSDYYAGRAYVRKNNGQGVIDYNGNLLLPLKYGLLSGHRHGYRIAYHAKPCGESHEHSDIIDLLDVNLQVALTTKLPKEVFRQGYVELLEHSSVVNHCDGFERKPGDDYVLVHLRSSGDVDTAAWMVDQNGETVIPYDDHYAFLAPFRCGLSRFAKFVKGELRFGYLDRGGNEVITAQYVEATDFRQERAFVSDKDGFSGYVDKQGKYIYKGKLLAGSGFADNKAFVWENGGLCVSMIEREGYVLKTFEGYSEAGIISNGLVRIRDGKTKHWGFLYPHWTSNPCKEGEYGFVDEIPIKPTYDYASDFKDGLAVVGIENPEGLLLYGLINREGETVIPCEWERSILSWDYPYNEHHNIDVPHPREGVWPVMRNGKCGFIDLKGHVQVPLAYDSICCSFRNGTTVLKKHGKYHYIQNPLKLETLNKTRCRKQ